MPRAFPSVEWCWLLSGGAISSPFSRDDVGETNGARIFDAPSCEAVLFGKRR